MRQRAVRLLMSAAEASVLCAMAFVALLYTPRLADNVLGKTAALYIMTALSTLFWGAACVLASRLPNLPRRSVALFLVFLLISAFATITARNEGLAWETWLLWAAYLALFVIVADLSRDVARARRLIVGMLGLTIVVSGLAGLQMAGIDLVGLPKPYRGMPLSTLGNTNFAAHFLEVLLPLSLVLAIRSPTRPLRALAVIAAVTGAGYLVVAGSRGGWLGCLVAGVVMLAAIPRPRDLGRRLLLAVLVAALLSPVAELLLRSVPLSSGRSAASAVEELVDESWDKAMSTFDGANFSRAMRLLIWRDSLRVIAENPWVGVGLGQYGYELAAYRSSTGQRDWKELMGQRGNQPYHAHNEFLETWAETGVLGVLALLGMLASGIGLCWRLTRSRHADPTVASFDCAIALGGLGGWVAVSVHALFSFSLRDPVSGMLLWILGGLIVGVWARQTRQRPHRTASAVDRLMLLAVCVGLALSCGWHGVGMLQADMHLLAGREYYSLGQPNRALLSFRQSVDWRDHDFSAHHWRGRAAQQAGRHAEAAEAYERSLALYANNPSTARALAQAALRIGTPERAIESLRQAIQVETLGSDNYALLADVLHQAQRPTEAAAARRQALSLRPGHGPLLSGLALDLRAAGHVDSAIMVLREATRTTPRSATIAGNLGALLLLQGQVVEAESSLRRAIQLEPTRGEWHGNLALALAAQDRIDDALLAARAAQHVEPDEERWRDLVQRLEASAQSE